MSFYKNINTCKCINGYNSEKYSIGEIGYFTYNGNTHYFRCVKNNTPDIYDPDGSFKDVGQCINCIFSKYNTCSKRIIKPICPYHQTFIEI